MTNLILLRHGESEWNLSNRFTGWTDVKLTENGIKEATRAAHIIEKNNLVIKSIYTSLLKRANDTAKIVSKHINFDSHEIKYDWRLNERHYGALQGLNKSETASKYGEEQVQVWRRSFNISPPLLSDSDERHPRFNKKLKEINCELPSGESLKDVIDRLYPFWKNYINFILKEKGDHLIVAHSNSLRAIVKILDNLSSEEIISVNIPTGVPLLYQLGNDLNVIDKKYLIDEKELKKKQEKIMIQGKAK
ncbi:2,3-diphosphoglycerate-dependent phosphoglycerate mutase [Candidatus Marinimicrobia bacterium]|nr:2,3-diphosphoglycerate-dependent phosphoglycerate mutase [Candidatus Neomarinimicrobiota bacterium]